VAGSGRALGGARQCGVAGRPVRQQGRGGSGGFSRKKRRKKRDGEKKKRPLTVGHVSGIFLNMLFYSFSFTRFALRDVFSVLQ
jgi:hypothetical protein